MPKSHLVTGAFGGWHKRFGCCWLPLGERYAAKFESFSTNTLPRYLDSFEVYLAKRDNKNFFVGNRLSMVGFVRYELFWQMTLMVPISITETNWPTLFDFIRAFEKSPSIANYRKRENYIEHPVNSPWASFA